jgi:hypothetical protein
MFFVARKSKPVKTARPRLTTSETISYHPGDVTVMTLTVSATGLGAGLGNVHRNEANGQDVISVERGLSNYNEVV